MTMKAIFDTKEFLDLDAEGKARMLDMASRAFESRDFDSEMDDLEREKQELQSKVMQHKEKIEGLESSVSKSENKLSVRKGQVLVELEDVKKQAGIFKQKADDLSKHKSALELKTATLKKSNLTSEIEELKTELESLREQKIERENSLVEIRANFDSFYDNYNEEMARLLLQEKIIFNNTNDETQNEEASFERFKGEQGLSEIRNQILITKENIEKFTMKCHAVEAEIAEKTEQRQDVAIPEESKELFVQAKDLESEIIIYDGMLAKLDKIFDSTKADIDDAKVLYSAELAIERKRDAELEKIDKSTAKVFENTELSNFEKLRNCDKSLADIYVVEYEIGLVDKQIENIKNKSKFRLEKAEECKEKISELSKLFEQKELVVRECKDILKDRQDDRESLLGNNHLSMLVEYTNIGDNCPVCKSKVTEKNYTPKTDLAGVEKEIEMARSRVFYAEKDRDSVLVGLAGYKSKLEFELDQVEFEKEEINRLESSKIKIYQRVVDVNDQMIENFGNIKNALKKTAGALEDLIELQYDLKESVQDNIAKKTEFGSRISLLSEKYEQLLDLYYVLQKERAEREMLLLEAKATVSESDFEKKRVEFSENQNLVENISSSLIELYMQLSELKTSIMVECEKLSELEYQKGKLESVASSSASHSNAGEADYSLDEIKEKMTALKESYKHLLSLKNDAENSMQNTLRDYDVKTKILASKIDELQDVSALVSSLVFRYGFADAEEARAFITTDNMIKIKESEIKSYNSRLAKLEAEYSLLSETTNNDELETAAEIIKLQKEIENALVRIGEINILLEQIASEKDEYKTVLELIKKTK